MAFFRLFLVLSFFSGSSAFSQTEAEFKRSLQNALRASPLSPVEKAQHVLDRLGYGPHPVLQPVSSLVSFNKDGRVDEAATDILIVDYILESMKPSGYPAAHLAPITEAYAHSEKSYREISAHARHLQKIRANKKEANDLEGELEARRRINVFERDLLKLSQARFLSHAVMKKYPFQLKLAYLWFNRFSIGGRNVSYDMTDYLTQINQRAFGDFEGLLETIVKHPGMLVYLHNSFNFVRYSRPAPNAPLEESNPPVEDFARELIELHTLGRVAGDETGVNQYNLADINAAARILSGWNLAGAGKDTTETLPRRFRFLRNNHAKGEKLFMGRNYPEGEAGGRALISFLSNHHLTASSVSRMLVRHFVTDSIWQTPPDPNGKYEPIPIVKELAQTFLSSQGDLKTVYQTMLASPDFWSRDAYRSKMKDPLHLVVSTLRGSGRRAILSSQTNKKATLSRSAFDLALTQMKNMNQELFMCALPTGYGETSGTWASVSNVMSFVKFAFENGTFAGGPEDPRTEAYREAERAAQLKRSNPEEMARIARNGFVQVYGLEVNPLYSRLPHEGAADAGVQGPLTLLQFGKNPDMHFTPESNGEWPLPVRSLASGYFGSAEFMKR